MKPNLRPKHHTTHLENSLIPPNDEGVGGQAFLPTRARRGQEALGLDG